MPELTDTDQRAITRRSKKLTKDQAKRALYIDFEGLKKEKSKEVTPTILGTLDITSARKRKFKAFILHENLHLLTRPRLYPEHGVSTIDREVMVLNEAIALLTQECKINHRVICAYTQHEIKEIRKWCSKDVYEAFEPYFYDAKQVIDLWVNKYHPNNRLYRGERTLDAYCHLFNVPNVPPPKPNVTDAIRKITAACKRYKKWRAVPNTTKASARQLFYYNKNDCESLYRLTVRAVNCLQQG